MLKLSRKNENRSNRRSRSSGDLQRAIFTGWSKSIEFAGSIIINIFNTKHIFFCQYAMCQKSIRLMANRSKSCQLRHRIWYGYYNQPLSSIRMQTSMTLRYAGLREYSIGFLFLWWRWFFFINSSFSFLKNVLMLMGQSRNEHTEMAEYIRSSMS